MSETRFKPIKESMTIKTLRSALSTLNPIQGRTDTPGELVLDTNDTPRLLHHPEGISADDFLFFAKDSSGPTKAAIRRARSLVAEQARQAGALIVEGDNRLIRRSFLEEVTSLPEPPEGLGIITLGICQFVLDHTMPVDTLS